MAWRGVHLCKCIQQKDHKVCDVCWYDNGGVEDISPGLFFCGLPAGSSVFGLSVNVSLFSCVELRLPRRPGERSAGEGSAPKGSLVDSHLLIQPVFCFNLSFIWYPQWIWYPGGRSLMFAREILPLSPSSNSTITFPSFSSSPGPYTVQQHEWCKAAPNLNMQRLLIKTSRDSLEWMWKHHAHPAGRIRDKDSENAHSSRHTLGSP